MVRFFQILICCLLLQSARTPEPASAMALSDMRIGLHDALTRIVLEADHPFAYRIFQLQNPARLIVDVPAMDWQVASLPDRNDSPLIQKSRYGLFNPDVLRIVLDLHSAVAVRRHVQYQNAVGKWLLLLEIATPDSAHPAAEGFLAQGWQDYLASRVQPSEAENFIPDGVIPAPLRSARPMPVTIMIDPGHGGPDPGAVAGGKTFEKDIVLKVAQRLQHHLEQRGFRALLTRDADFYIPLGKRYRMAQNQQADLFISLHADAAENPKATGATVYTLSEKASDREAAKLAQKENASDILVGVSGFEDYDDSVQQVLLSMSQRITQYDSVQLARAVVPELAQATNVKPNPHRSAGFAVLKSPSIPSILVELGYMSNPKDRKKLLERAHRDTLAQALAAGIAGYFDKQQQNG